MHCAYQAKVSIVWSSMHIQGIIMLELTGVVIVGLDEARFEKQDSKVGWGCPCLVRSCREHYTISDDVCIHVAFVFKVLLHFPCSAVDDSV